MLVVNRACPEHNRGTCPWGHDHDQDKAAVVRGQPELLEIAKSRLKAKELSKKAGLSNGASDDTTASYGGGGGRKSDGGAGNNGRSRGGRKGGRGGTKRWQRVECACYQK